MIVIGNEKTDIEKKELESHDGHDHPASAKS